VKESLSIFYNATLLTFWIIFLTFAAGLAFVGMGINVPYLETGISFIMDNAIRLLGELVFYLQDIIHRH